MLESGVRKKHAPALPSPFPMALANLGHDHERFTVAELIGSGASVLPWHVAALESVLHPIVNQSKRPGRDRFD